MRLIYATFTFALLSASASGSTLRLDSIFTGVACSAQMRIAGVPQQFDTASVSGYDTQSSTIPYGGCASGMANLSGYASSDFGAGTIRTSATAALNDGLPYGGDNTLSFETRIAAAFTYFGSTVLLPSDTFLFSADAFLSSSGYSSTNFAVQSFISGGAAGSFITDLTSSFLPYTAFGSVSLFSSYAGSTNTTSLSTYQDGNTAAGYVGGTASVSVAPVSGDYYASLLLGHNSQTLANGDQFFIAFRTNTYASARSNNYLGGFADVDSLNTSRVHLTLPSGWIFDPGSYANASSWLGLSSPSPSPVPLPSAGFLLLGILAALALLKAGCRNSVMGRYLT